MTGHPDPSSRKGYIDLLDPFVIKAPIDGMFAGLGL
jgi:hypothetical protein